MNNTTAHQKLVDELLLAFGSKVDVRVWIRTVGYDHNRKIKYGIPGESDIDGIVAPWGRRLSIEVKTGSGRLSFAQRRFKKMIETFGGIYIVARTVEQSIADFETRIGDSWE